MHHQLNPCHAPAVRPVINLDSNEVVETEEVAEIEDAEEDPEAELGRVTVVTCLQLFHIHTAEFEFHDFAPENQMSNISSRRSF